MNSNYQENMESRYDLELIVDLVNKKSKVLDIGCGNGDLLELLVKNKKCDARGIELSTHLVSKALSKGLSVIQGDAERDLEHYPDDTFDYAILSHTIQATKRPDMVIKEMLRIADRVIVSLPNFANFRNRFHLFFKGTMPVNESIPYQWYETPNIHFCSIKDFKNLCCDMNIEINKERYLIGKCVINNHFAVNLIADYGVFLIEKDGLSMVKSPALASDQKKEVKVGSGNLQPA